MQNYGVQFCRHGLEQQGIKNAKNVYWNLNPSELYEESIRRGEGILAEGGPLVIKTGKHTGRSPNDKFVVKEPSSESEVWWGNVNYPFEQADFDKFEARFMDYIENLDDLFVQDCFVGTDPEHRMSLRVITDAAWQSLFSHNMFVQPTSEEAAEFVPEFTIIAAPSFKADPKIDGTNSEVAIMLNFGKKVALIAGSSYGGEVKKTAFTVMNYYMPKKGVLSMHCSANVGNDGISALFFGLSGTGKTTLSADPERGLIGDDEHGWTENGVFNFEGGCYAKVIRLSEEAEPQIYATTHTFGTILENVVVDDVTRKVDLDDSSLTENTRSSYPLTQIANHVSSGRAGHPKNVIFLTADAFGVMPPISKLSPAQAMYHFLSGYTAKVAGTEKGIVEPQATFSSCFGAPFMVHHPTVYAALLGKKLEEYGAQCWLVNTGWTGGPYGVGNRMKIAYTRAMLSAALRGDLDEVGFEEDDVFGVMVPVSCPGVPSEVLKPKNTWSDKAAYDEQANKLADMFLKNFVQFEDQATPDMLAAAPRVK